MIRTLIYVHAAASYDFIRRVPSSFYSNFQPRLLHGMPLQEVSYPGDNSLAGRYNVPRAVLYHISLCDVKVLGKRSALQCCDLPVLIPGAVDVQRWQADASKASLMLLIFLYGRWIATAADCKAQAALWTAPLLSLSPSAYILLSGTHGCSNGCALHSIELNL